MNIEKRIELALKISEGIENGKICSNNLYDLQLHLSDALEQVKKLTIPVVVYQREQLKAFADFIQSDTSHMNYDFKDLVQEYLDSL